MSNDVRMTYDNTFILVDIHVHPQTMDMSAQRGDRSVYVADITMIHDMDTNPYMSLRDALDLGLITEFDFQRCQ